MVLAPVARLAPAPDDIRVLVVDDAAVSRRSLEQWVDSEPGLMLAASASTGREALDVLARADPDVVVLDIDMPELDGLATLPLMLRRRRDLAIIMVASLTRRNAEIGLKALAIGAADCVARPDAPDADPFTFRRDLLLRIVELGQRRRRRKRLTTGRLATPPGRAASRLGTAIRSAAQFRIPDDVDDAGYPVRPFAEAAPRVLLVGASTGGPQALTRLLSRIGVVADCAPVLIAQHLPAPFTPVLAANLSRISDRPVREAVDGEPVLAGRVYLAPGGRHMRVARGDGIARIVLDDAPPHHFAKPAVDLLFESAAEVWGGWNLALVLTGMGEDGAAGAGAIAAQGGSVIAQDEASSVLWGMPRAAIDAGACAAVLPLEQIAPRVVRLFLGLQ